MMFMGHRCHFKGQTQELLLHLRYAHGAESLKAIQAIADPQVIATKSDFTYVIFLKNFFVKKFKLHILDTDICDVQSIHKWIVCKPKDKAVVLLWESNVNPITWINTAINFTKYQI